MGPLDRTSGQKRRFWAFEIGPPAEIVDKSQGKCKNNALGKKTVFGPFLGPWMAISCQERSLCFDNFPNVSFFFVHFSLLCDHDLNLFYCPYLFTFLIFYCKKSTTQHTYSTQHPHTTYDTHNTSHFALVWCSFWWSWRLFPAKPTHLTTHSPHNTSQHTHTHTHTTRISLFSFGFSVFFHAHTHAHTCTHTHTPAIDRYLARGLSKSVCVNTRINMLEKGKVRGNSGEGSFRYRLGNRSSAAKWRKTNRTIW